MVIVDLFQSIQGKYAIDKKKKKQKEKDGKQSSFFIIDIYER